MLFVHWMRRAASRAAWYGGNNRAITDDCNHHQKLDERETALRHGFRHETPAFLRCALDVELG